MTFLDNSPSTRTLVSDDQSKCKIYERRTCKSTRSRFDIRVLTISPSTVSSPSLNRRIETRSKKCQKLLKLNETLCQVEAVRRHVLHYEPKFRISQNLKRIDIHRGEIYFCYRHYMLHGSVAVLCQNWHFTNYLSLIYCYFHSAIVVINNHFH